MEVPMKRLFSLLVIALVILAPGTVSAATNTEKVNAAVESARAWLAVVDDGKYEDSWDQSAAYFRKMVPKETWVSQLTQYRAPMGRTESRSVQSASYLPSLPGAGPGEYVVIIFKAKMASGKTMTETVTPMLDTDG